jgi:hypothetical protein
MRMLVAATTVLTLTECGGSNDRFYDRAGFSCALMKEER